MNLFRFKKPEPESDDENSIEGERELTSVNSGIKLQNRITNWAVVVGVCALAGVMLYKYYAGMYHDYKEAKAAPKDITRTVTTATLPPLTMPDPEPVKAAAPAAPVDVLPPLQPPAGAAAASTVVPTSPDIVKPLAKVVRERRLKRELRFNLDGGSAAAEGTASAGEPGSIATTDRPQTAVTKAGERENTGSSRAYLLPEPTLMITRGRAIPCTLVPAVDTTLTGIVTCMTAEDVTGADNKVSLMDRGTFCTGRQGGGVIHGQRRVGIIWERCETPQHVLVPIDAGAVDALGRPGIAGSVDNHFWDRFGAAIAVSLISEIGPYLTATRQSGSNNTTVAFPNLTGPQEVMSEVLKSTANIPPTITAAHGGRVLIYLAGDIDFRDVYQLERTK